MITTGHFTLGPIAVAFEADASSVEEMEQHLALRDDYPDNAAFHLTVGSRRDPAGPRDNLEFRQRQMLKGHRLSLDFGPALDLAWSGNSCRIFGPKAGKAVWTYFVKAACTKWALQNHAGHFKLAACSEGDRGILVCGTGKTTLLQLLLNDPTTERRFVTNTHALVGDRFLHGVHSNLRIRRPTGEGHDRTPDQVYLSPQACFGAERVQTQCEPTVLIIRTEVTQATLQVSRPSPDQALEYLRQFTLALSYYDLEEDLLMDWCGGHLQQYANQMGDQVARLRRLLDRVELVHLRGHIDKQDLSQILRGRIGKVSARKAG